VLRRSGALLPAALALLLRTKVAREHFAGAN
jgi:hypothetical protein